MVAPSDCKSGRSKVIDTTIGRGASGAEPLERHRRSVSALPVGSASGRGSPTSATGAAVAATPSSAGEAQLTQSEEERHEAGDRHCNRKVRAGVLCLLDSHGQPCYLPTEIGRLGSQRRHL